MVGTDSSSPSYHRRKALRDADAKNKVTILPSFPLESYFEVASRLLQHFQQALDERRLDETYVYGLRFATLIVECLPKHPSYSNSRFKPQTVRSAQQVEKVLSMMEIVTQRMDVEETLKETQREEDLHQREAEEARKRAQAQAQEAAAQERAANGQEERKRIEKQNQLRVEKSAYAKLQAMKERMNDAQETEEQLSGTQTQRLQQQKHDSAQENRERTIRTKDKQLANLKRSAAVYSTKESTGDAVSVPGSGASAAERRSPRRSATSVEERTIEMLELTMRKQEDRLKEIEELRIPALLKQAKQHLREGDRKKALSCVHKRRKLDHLMDISKGAIFQLETRIFQIENALEGRHVQEALEAASEAMDGIQKSVGGIDPDTLQDDLLSFAVSPEANSIDVVDEEELLRELEQWTTPEKSKSTSQTILGDDDISILSLPQVPTSPADRQTAMRRSSRTLRRELA